MLKTTNNIVKQEQYIDFIKNTKFRASLLSHSENKLNRNINIETIKDFYFYFNFITNNTVEDIAGDKSMQFTSISNQEVKLNINNVIIKSIFYSLYLNLGKAISLDKLLASTIKLLKSVKINIDRDSVINSMNNFFLDSIFKQIINITAINSKNINAISKKPKVSNLVMMQIKQKKFTSNIFITSQISQSNYITPIFQRIIILCNGINTVDDIRDQLIDDIQNGIFTIIHDNVQVQDKEQITQILDYNINKVLSFLKIHHFLVA